MLWAKNRIGWTGFDPKRKFNNTFMGPPLLNMDGQSVEADRGRRTPGIFALCSPNLALIASSVNGRLR